MKRLSETSWIDIHQMDPMPSTEEVDELVEAMPTTRNTIKLPWTPLPVEIPRFEQLYGPHNYHYSGIERIANPNVPALVQRCIDYMSTKYPLEGGATYEGALVNWYPDGKSSIGKHSDDENDLVPGAPIGSFSFLEKRVFRVRPRENAPEGADEGFDVITEHGMVMVMGGNMQKEYTHKVPKMARRISHMDEKGKVKYTKDKKVKLRINVTVRAFRQRTDEPPSRKRLRQDTD